MNKILKSLIGWAGIIGGFFLFVGLAMFGSLGVISSNVWINRIIVGSSPIGLGICMRSAHYWVFSE